MFHAKIKELTKKDGGKVSLVVETATGETFNLASTSFRKPYKLTLLSGDYRNHFGLLEGTAKLESVPKVGDSVLLESGIIEGRGRRWTTLKLWEPLRKEYNSEVLTYARKMEGEESAVRLKNSLYWGSFPGEEDEKTNLAIAAIDEMVDRITGFKKNSPER